MQDTSSLQVMVPAFTIIAVCVILSPLPHFTPEMADQNVKLHVLQWNCRNINSNLNQLTQFLYNSASPYHVICLQSLYVKKQRLPLLANYYCPFFSEENGRVRTATYVRKPLKAILHKQVEGVACDVCEIYFSPTESLKIFNVYYPTGCTDVNVTRWIASLQAGNVLVLGDFNAHHSMWEGVGTQTSRGGQWLYEHITESNLCLLNDGSFTHIPDRNDQQPSIIDLTLISSELFIDTDWQTIGDPLGSDHVPISISVGKVIVHNINQGQHKYNYEKANWNEFAECLENADYSVLDMNFSIENQYESLRTIVLSAADVAIPKKAAQTLSKYPPNPWWSEECHVAVTIKRRAYKKYKRKQNEETYANLREARINCKRTIAQSKVLYWRTYLDKNVSKYSDTKILFKHVKRIKQRYCPVERPLDINGDKTKTDFEKAEVLAEVFAKASRSEGLSKSLKTFREKEDKKRKDPVRRPGCPLNKTFSMAELRTCIKSVLNNKKATGSDPISYRMIQHFPGKTLEALLSFFNHCWDTGTVPAAWKQATVIAVPKAGKNPSNPNSYRPISLTPHLGKIYERIVKARLEHHLQKNNIIPVLQAGFQRGRGCSDHIVKLSAHVKKALAKRRTTLAAFYDVHRAYDSVWHGRLLSKLANIGLSGNIFDFCKSFLSNRSFCVKTGAALSQSRSVDMGVPQGSIIAPTFFNIMLYDITSVKLKGAHITLYADDLLLFSTEDYKNLKSSFVRKVIMKRFQYNVNQLVEYMKENGFALAASKTVFMIFNRSRYNPNDFFITIDNCKIYPSSEVKYLGVVIDRNFTWLSHVKRNIEKTRHVWNLLKLLKKTEGASDVKNLCHVVRALVRSRLLYGHEAYFGASKNVLDKLQTTECKFLRFVLDTKNSVPQEVVYREVGWLPLSYEIKLRTTQYIYRSSAVPNSTEEELDIEFDNFHDVVQQQNFRKNPRINGRMLSVANFTEEITKQLQIKRTEVVKIPSCPIPPWEVEELKIKANLGNFNKTDHAPILSTLAKEAVTTEYSGFLHVYTDGSKLENDQVGCAFYIPSLQVTKLYRLNDGVSILSAEMFAIVMALSYCNDYPQDLSDIVILSDSKSALQAIDSKSKNRREMSLEIELLVHQLKLKGHSVSFQWIPSHCGVKGNEIVDRAAKDSALLPSVTNNVQFTVSEISCKLKQIFRTKWKEKYKTLAEDRNWIVDNTGQDGLCPEFPRYQLPIFHRLRGKTYLVQYTPHACCCGEPLSYWHIFACQRLIPTMAQVNSLAQCNDIEISAKSLLNKHPVLGWQLVKAFIHGLVQSDIGHLI